ncbi:uncharacterized protein MONBRDRAFT_33201 [Monosiga brevicollis MX1]|uniref:DnaJ homolog subfamily C member 2 n=1 Tax=Monosiga brevicollis TaxID=81824 RepID=A9V447_MONBE|nr:uncharacterized protein MONBRDRAFT_33201 [Monosiga brevicollis MX1]EDQ87643.1 predicted protein [Monosiga brevicollis MX1]|eukprot:XP_001747563.1 hypothetical protein [Monosiga brevicollis MX1]
MRAVVAGVLLLLASASAKNTFSPYWGEYKTSSGPVEGKINVHLVPHTHDDTGWLITVDQYFYQRVSYIISTVMVNLEANPDRKFIYVETGFFERWWVEQDNATQARFNRLVQNGQLEFINGGWCMHDEASPTYVEMTENTGRGHLFLKKYFNIAPKGTWQIDPFGHTNTQGWLMGQYSGFQFLYFGRMDYQDFAMRKNLTTMAAEGVPRSLEWVWQGADTFGSQYQTFTGELYGGGGGGYGAPNNMGFDSTDNTQVQDDPRLMDYNIDQFVEEFIADAVDQAQHMRTNHVLYAMGSDFNYVNALLWYNNMDKLIHHVNKNGTVNAFYSTPSIYTQAKFDANETWEARYDDIMPLADNAHHYWTGYFTSRQSLKKYLRVLTNVLNAARQLAMLTETDTCTSTSYSQTVCTDNLEAALAVTTHHDGLSGTEKQAVADDYALRMSIGETETRKMMAQVLEKAVGLDKPEFCYGTPALNISFCAFTADRDAFTVFAYNPQGRPASQVLRVPIKGSTASVTGPEGQTVESQVIAIDARERELSKLYLQFNEMNDTSRVGELTNNATHVVTFVADLPIMGWNTYQVKVGGSDASSHTTSYNRRVNEPITISNDLYSVSVGSTDALVAEVTNLKSGVKSTIGIDIGFYNSSVGGCTAGVGTWELNEKLGKAPKNPLNRDRREEFEDGMEEPVDLEDDSFACDGQKSGAYIFRPNTTNVWPAACTEGDCNRAPTFTSSTGELVSEIYVTYASWATLVLRLVKGEARVEVDYTVGPIPQESFEGGSPYLQGKEIVLRYNSSLHTNGTLYHDSNAREMIERKYNLRGPTYPSPYQISEPVAGNYYPVNALLALEDKAANIGLSIAMDRSMGGASLADGSMELMVHRRTQDDDSRGVGQPMNETMCGCRDQDPNNIGQCGCAGLTIKGTNWLYLDTIPNTNAARRAGFEDLNFGPIVAFSESKPTKPTFTGLSAALPDNVKLMTFGVVSPQYNDEVFLRLSHIFQANEHPTLSQNVNVSLTHVFAKAGLKITSATEVSLTGNMTPQELEARRYKWKVAGETEAMPSSGASLVPGMRPFDEKDASLTVELRPMDIRTTDSMAAELEEWALPVADGDESSAIFAALAETVEVELEAAGRWFEEHARIIRLNLPVMEDDDGDDDDDDDDDDDVDDGKGRASQGGDDNDDDLVNIAGEWKDQDHYALLGLEQTRWRATANDIKKAYKKMVLKHHPDKKGDLSGAEAKAADEYFDRIQRAYDLLSNEKQRRMYDSVDDVDDSVPAPCTDEARFYETFGPAFERNARWFATQPVPQLGSPDTKFEDVEHFYHFWYHQKTWREFGYDDDEDPSKADSREERRWMEKQLRARRKKRKKEENARMLKLVDHAYSSDPRIRARREQAKKEKLARKNAQAEARRKQAEERERVEREAREAKEAAEQAAREEEKRKNEEHKKARRNLTKACRDLGLYDTENPATTEKAERDGVLSLKDMEDIKTLPAKDLIKLAEITNKEQMLKTFRKLLSALRQKGSSDSDKTAGSERPWTKEEQALLEQAIIEVKATASDRWIQIAKRVPGRKPKEVLLRIKQCREQAQKQAFKAPAEWLEEEEVVAKKAASRVHPPGTQGDRWGMIAQYVKAHARTPWLRSNKDVIAKVNSMKNVLGGLKAKQATRDDFAHFQKTNLKNPTRNRARVEHMNDPTLKDTRADLLAHLDDDAN